MPKNPFVKADPLAAGGGGGAWGGAAGAGAGGFGAGAGQAVGAGGDDYDVVEIIDDQPAAAPVPSGRAAQNGAKGFGSREATLAKREQEVKSREAALRARGAHRIDPMMIKNFPSCCPIVHHDIVNDIPEYNQNIMRAGFMLFLLTVLALTWNFVAVLMAVITVRFEHGATAAWFFAALYFVIGVPGAWFTWYGRLYRAMMNDGALSFAGFFFFILVHAGFAVFSAVAPAFSKDGLAYAHAGWLPTIDLFKLGGYKFAAICYGIGAGLWSMTGVFTFIFMARVYNKMRGGNVTERARQEAVAMGAHMAADEMRRNAETTNNGGRR